MYLAVDIGGTKTLLARFDNGGTVVAEDKFPTPQDYSEFLKELAANIEQLGSVDYQAASVAAPGRLDRSEGIALAFGNLPWEHIHIQADIEHIIHCPVVIENDAKLAGLSEAVLLKDQYSKVLYVTVSTGIGTGVIVDGEIESAFADTEGGQIILEHNGKLVHWESFASGKAIVEQFGKRASDITDESTWRIIARNLSIGLIDLIAVIQPEVIVFGGGVSTNFEKFSAFLLEELKKYETPLLPLPAIVKAARPEEAVIYGCYELAKAKYGHATAQA